MKNLTVKINSGESFTFGIYSKDFPRISIGGLSIDMYGSLMAQTEENLYLVKLSNRYTNKMRGSYNVCMSTSNDTEGVKKSDTLFTIEIKRCPDDGVLDSVLSDQPRFYANMEGEIFKTKSIIY